jgi:hypothetical protein
MDVSTSTLAGGLIEVKVALGPNIFLWNVDYNAKTFSAQNGLAKVIEDSVKPKP